jgi:hypothetical protein
MDRLENTFDLDDVMTLNHMVDLEPYEWLMWLPAPAPAAATTSAGGSGGEQPYESFIWFKVNHMVQSHYVIKVEVKSVLKSTHPTSMYP